MKVFFAIEFEEEVKEYLFSIKEDIKQHCTAGNFTLKENFHLTLRFIGEQSQSQTEQLIAALKETAANMPTFELMLNKLGKFDKRNRKIIWVGLQKSQEVEALYSKLESVLAKHGYQKEDRNFSPHITLAREVRLEGFEEMANKEVVNNLAIKARAISLMESKRIDNKLCYMPIERVEFASV
ncbi:MAG TPA: RNA 2',3'-cyclic phosphodiesterase [Ruminiclostridium sp.]